MDKKDRMKNGSEHTPYVQIPNSDRMPFSGAQKVGQAKPEDELLVTVVVRRPSMAHVIEKLGPPNFSKERHLSHEEFETHYGADPKDILRIENFAKEHNLVIEEVNAAAGTIQLSGNVTHFSQAFDVELNQYEHADFSYRGRTGHVHIPQELADIVEAVLGLDDRPQLHPHFQIYQETDTLASRQAKTNAYTPPQIAELYDFPTHVNVNQSEQSIGIIELGGGYSPDEIKQYLTSIGIQEPKITDVSVNGATNQPTGSPNGPDGEVALDIEVAAAVAPGVNITVYFAPNTDAGFLNAIKKAIHDKKNKPSVISISWGSAEKNWTKQAMKAMDRAFQDAASLGVTICAAAGDRGSADGITDGLAHVDFPASSPHVLACGGTRLEGSGSTIIKETVWNEGPNSSTGGGVSDVFDLPKWQVSADVPASANPDANIGRGVPDVAGDADPATGYIILVDGKKIVIGGTSAVAPLWAGLIALMNAELAQPVGFMNPYLYQPSTRGAALHDITEGNNNSTWERGAYDAHIGWDACTGLGSPDGKQLLKMFQGINRAVN